MKIKNQKISYLGFGKKYVMYRGELVCVTIIGRKIVLADFSIDYHAILPNGDKVSLNDKENKFYESQQDFENGHEAVRNCSSTIDNILNRTFGMPCVLNEENVNGIVCMMAIPFCWIFEDGEPRTVEPTIHQIVINKDNDNKLDGVNIPDKYYKTREDVLKWHDYTVREEDGTVHVHKAILPLVVLTKEQKDAVNSIVDAYKKARDLGVRFFWDSEDETQKVININNIERYENTDNYDYKSRVKNGEKGLIGMKSLRADLSRKEFISEVNVFDFWLSCDYDLYVKVNDGQK